MGGKESLILIFSIIEIVSSFAIFLSPQEYLIQEHMISLALILMFTALITYIVVWVLVAKDIKEKGISWGFMVLPILLGGIGGIIYWILNREKRGFTPSES